MHRCITRQRTELHRVTINNRDAAHARIRAIVSFTCLTGRWMQRGAHWKENNTSEAGTRLCPLRSRAFSTFPRNLKSISRLRTHSACTRGALEPLSTRLLRSCAVRVLRAERARRSQASASFRQTTLSASPFFARLLRCPHVTHVRTYIYVCTISPFLFLCIDGNPREFTVCTLTAREKDYILYEKTRNDHSRLPRKDASVPDDDDN